MKIPRKKKKSALRCIALSVLLQLKKDLSNSDDRIRQRATRYMKNENNLGGWCEIAQVDAGKYLEAIPDVPDDFDFVEEYQLQFDF